MPLLVEQLQLWTICFKWAGLDPNGLWLRLPTPVRENASSLLEAILEGHLTTSYLNLEKYKGEDHEIAKFHIRYWIEDVYKGIWGQSYNRALLKHAVIERYAFQDWCERRSIPLPEFWFPAGYSEYRWPEDDSPAPLEVAEALPGAAQVDSKSDMAVPTSDASLIAMVAPENDPALAWRDNQRYRAACQVIAEVLWKANPDMTIADMSKHELIRTYGRGANYGQETVRDWIKVVAPTAVREKRGRPRTKTPPKVDY